MSKLKLKVCGMRELQNIEAVAERRPDFMGFIFYKESPRYVGESFHMPDLPASIQRVGVFVNEQVEVIEDIANRFNLTYIQLHGDEPPELVSSLKSIGFKVIKVFRINDELNSDLLSQYGKYVDYFMFDTKGDQFGGTGKTFDWSVLRTYKEGVPFFLSGGLNASNIQQIDSLQDLNIYALDLNSGVEHSPGNKDLVKLDEVIDKLAML